MSEVDFSKIDPLVKEYLADLREILKKSQAEAKQATLERDAYREQLEELKKAKIPEQTQTPLDARTLSDEEYLKFRRDMLKDMRLKKYDEKLKQAFGDGQKDVLSMSSEEYAKWKQRMRRLW